MLDILYYAKSRDLEVQELDAAKFLADTAALIRPRADKADVRFAFHAEESLGFFQIDAAALSAALVNFLENAVDACEDVEDEQRQVELSASGTPDHVVITVKDQGQGMDKETRDKIFTLFFSSKGSKGTGLGLFISNQTIEKHGGSISVNSEPGKGSTFTITLPRKQPTICPSRRSSELK